MTLKIGLEKVYDRLSWAFIRDTLHEIGLGVWIGLTLHEVFGRVTQSLFIFLFCAWRD